MQQSSIGSFGKWDGVHILYHSLITKTVYCAALPQTIEVINFSLQYSGKICFIVSILYFAWEDQSESVLYRS